MPLVRHTHLHDTGRQCRAIFQDDGQRDGIDTVFDRKSIPNENHSVRDRGRRAMEDVARTEPFDNIARKVLVVRGADECLVRINRLSIHDIFPARVGIGAIALRLWGEGRCRGEGWSQRRGWCKC